MNEKFYSELSRRLKREGIAIGEAANKHLPVLLENQTAMWISPRGDIFLEPEFVHDQRCTQLYDRVAEISAQVHEYTAAMVAAPRLVADGLHENFRLLADFNGVVLAGQELERDWGYKFVTWRRDGDGAGVAHGNYYHNDYDGAKLDFACRSGLVQESRQFTDEQLVEMYRCIHETLDGEYPIARERRDVLTAAARQIERGVDDLDERVSQSNRRELELADQRNDSPGWEMTP